MAKVVEIRFEGSPIDAEALRKACQKLAEMPGEDRKRFVELIIDPKTAAAVKKHWKTIQMFK